MSEPRILTFTGRMINPLNVRKEDVCVEDVAHSLALINRFNGCTRWPIPVAQHVVHVSYLLEGTGLEWQGLHHDDGEAYVGDMVKWLKEDPAMLAFQEAEERAQRACYQAFGCDPIHYESHSHFMHPKVHEADRLMVRYEGWRGYGHVIWTRWTTTYAHIHHAPNVDEQARIYESHEWRYMSCMEAKEFYLGRHHELIRRGLNH